MVVGWHEIRKAVDDLKQLDSAALRNLIQKGQFQTNGISQADKTDKHNLFLRELPSVPYRDRKDRNRERIEGTCEWFTSHEIFRNWRCGQPLSLLLVSADPGCGKSVLAKHLVDNVLPATSTRSTCYFFFKDDFEDQRSLEGAIRCILHQLFLQKPALLTDKIVNKFTKDKHLFSSFASLWDILTSASCHADAGEVICIIDALDECEDISRLTEALAKLYEDGADKSSLKFLLTSRPYSHIRRGFQPLENQYPEIHLDGANEVEVDKISKEIDIVIKSNARETGQQLNLEDEEIQLLEGELTRIAHRTYLWVYLVFDVINNSEGITKGHLKAIIHQLPGTVEAAYEKILRRSADITKARRLLHIVVAAERPLSLQEMATALAIREEHKAYSELELEPEDRFRNTVRGLCGLFVTIVHSEIYLLHQTAREFLVYNSSRLTLTNTGWQNSFHISESHRTLAEICITYLCFPNLEALGEDSLPAFMHYAAENWPAHFRKASDQNTEKTICCAKSLCDRSHNDNEWFKIYWHARGFYPMDGALDGLSSLTIASLLGLEEVVCMLLKEKGSDFDIRDDSYNRSALSWACTAGYEAVVEILLNFDTRRHRRIFGWNPLLEATADGREGIVRLLLEKGAKLNLTNILGESALCIAAGRGYEGIVKLLLEGGARVNLTNTSGESALYKAAEEGYEGIVKLLLERGAKVDPKSRQHRSPLTAAARGGHKAILRLLLEKGAKTDVPSSDNEAPLLAVAGHGDEESVRLLLERGANTEARDSEYLTPLHRAVYEGHEKVVQQLLSKGATIEITYSLDLDWGGFESKSRGKGAQQLLKKITKRGDENIVRQLLEKGANAETHSRYGRTPLFEAVYGGHEKIVRWLLEKGAKVEAGDIMMAQRGQHEKILQLLEEGG
ncbi:putative ankyrin repeat-containing protein [Daldinia grandis]|nr:putative ankyrin repeat-containing protein [Daldinia grandis]